MRYEVLVDTTDEVGSRADAGHLGLTYDIVQENGPGGGWPEIRVCGEEDKLRKFLENHLGSKADGEEYFTDFANPIS